MHSPAPSPPRHQYPSPTNTIIMRVHTAAWCRRRSSSSGQFFIARASGKFSACLAAFRACRSRDFKMHLCMHIPLAKDWLIVRNSIKNKSDLNVKYCLYIHSTHSYIILCIYIYLCVCMCAYMRLIIIVKNILLLPT